MKMKLLSIVLLAGFLGMGSQTSSAQFGGATGWMNVFENNGGTQGGWLWGSGWGLADLKAITVDDLTFELLPNVNTYNATDPYWSDGLGDGNKWMEANVYREHTVTLGELSATMQFSVSAFDLNSRYTLQAYVKTLDPNNGWATTYTDYIAITGTTGTVSLTMNTASSAGQVLQFGFVMNGLNANPVDDWGSATVTIESLTIIDSDTAAPSPDPMTFAVVPYALSDSAISMTATTATDAHAVQYLFTNTVTGVASGWQSSPTYVAAGLSESTLYGFRVKARDLSSQTNETAWSSIESASTLSSDTEPPSPDPMTFAATEASPITIKLTATTATDASSVEYFFDCVAGDGNDSEWQSSPVYVDTGLVPGSNYTYTVTARDTSSVTNTTAASDPVVVTTSALPGSFSLASSLKGFTGDSTQSLTQHALAMAGFELASDTAEKIVTFDAAGAKFGNTATWQSRNVLRTLGQDYGDADFEVYATCIIQGTTEQTSFIGVGQGLIGNWGVPDFELAGVNTVFGEAQFNWCKMFTFTNGVQKALDETAPITTVTNRFRMVHDATAQTITVELDTGYAGGAFVSDRTLGTHSTVGVWEDMPQRIYLGAGAGVVWKDLAITAGSAPVIGVDDLTIAPTSGGMLLTWTSVAGQSYDVVYKTDLTAVSWDADTSPGCSDIPGTGGSLSVTSTVSSAEAFYNVVTQ